MASDSLHIVKHNGGWAVKKTGRETPLSTHDTKAAAVDAGEKLCHEEGYDLVIHRRNGTFQEVKNYEHDEHHEEEVPMATTTRATRARVATDEDEDEKVRARDIFELGTRVAWSAIIAGLVIAFVTYTVMTSFGAAIGMTFSGWFEENSQTAAGLGILWFMLTMLVSMFLGGFVTSRSVAGEDHQEAARHGVLLWGTMVLTLPYLTLFTASLMGGAAAAVASPETAEQASNQAQAVANNLSGIMSGVSITEAGWWAFAALVVSLAASVTGALCGSGPEFVIRRETR